MTGKYASPNTTTIEERALKKESREKSTLHVYEIAEDVGCLKSSIAPWLNQMGGGIQYRFQKSVLKLIKEGVLVERKL